MTKVAVHAVSPMTDSKFTGFPTQRVTFKNLEDKGPKYYYLNLDRKWPEHNQWLPHLELGTVLDVQLYGDKNVSIFSAPTVLREVK